MRPTTIALAAGLAIGAAVGGAGYSVAASSAPPVQAAATPASAAAHVALAGAGGPISPVDGAGPGGRLTAEQKQAALEYFAKHLPCMREHGFALPDPVVGTDSVTVDLTGIPGTEPFDKNSAWYRTSKACDAALRIEFSR
jgi:hypothetical protein